MERYLYLQENLEEKDIPTAQDESKITAMSFFTMMKNEIPIILLYKESDLKKMFKQPSTLKIIVETRPITSDQMEISEIEPLLQQLESNLFIAKRQIDLLTDIEKYSEITELFKISNKKLKPIVRSISGFPVSQAYLKMCEILHETPLVNKKHIKVLHLCEAPGQFILAFKKYCNDKKITYEWNATTLKSGFGDNYGLIRSNKEKWLWGVDGTGDITNYMNVKSLGLIKYDVLTSDCGQMTQSFGFQEEELLHIHLGQLTATLLALKVGGNCVFKTFLPIVLPLNMSLFYIMYRCFEKIMYFKPTLNPRDRKSVV
jgi:23S rRNA U2552 (ribose-2'-O)-methylase RlmE/FtsJ